MPQSCQDCRHVSAVPIQMQHVPSPFTGELFSKVSLSFTMSRRLSHFVQRNRIALTLYLSEIKSKGRTGSAPMTLLPSVAPYNSLSRRPRLSALSCVCNCSCKVEHGRTVTTHVSAAGNRVPPTQGGTVRQLYTSRVLCRRWTGSCCKGTPADLQALAALGVMLCNRQHLAEFLGVHEEKHLMGWQFSAFLRHKHTVWRAQLLNVRGQVAQKLLLGICHAWHSSRKSVMANKARCVDTDQGQSNKCGCLNENDKQYIDLPAAAIMTTASGHSADQQYASVLGMLSKFAVIMQMMFTQASCSDLILGFNLSAWSHPGCTKPCDHPDILLAAKLLLESDAGMLAVHAHHQRMPCSGSLLVADSQHREVTSELSHEFHISPTSWS